MAAFTRTQLAAMDALEKQQSGLWLDLVDADLEVNARPEIARCILTYRHKSISNAAFGAFALQAVTYERWRFLDWLLATHCWRISAADGWEEVIVALWESRKYALSKVLLRRYYRQMKQTEELERLAEKSRVVRRLCAELGAL